MILILNEDGSLFTTYVNEYVNQHSHNVNYFDFAIISKSSEDFSCDCLAILPDKTQVVLSANQKVFSYNSVSYSGYRVYISNSITIYAGAVKLIFRSYDTTGAILYTYPYILNVNATSRNVDTPNITESEYQTMLTRLNSYLTKYDSAVIRKYNSYDLALADIDNLNEQSYVLVNQDSDFKFYKKVNGVLSQIYMSYENLKELENYFTKSQTNALLEKKVDLTTYESGVKTLNEKITALDTTIESLNKEVPTDLYVSDNTLQLYSDDHIISEQTPVEFKTINGNSIFGSGNIEIVSESSGSDVEVNVSVPSGTETSELSTLKVGENYFKAYNGSNVKRHFVRLVGTATVNEIPVAYDFNFTFISESGVSIDSLTDLNTYVPKTSEDNFAITITGYAYASDTSVNPLIVGAFPTFILNSSYQMSGLVGTIGDGGIVWTNITLDLSGATITDDITTIAI